jgi:hypothetical protein
VANDNCLVNMRCPKCGSFEPFRLEVVTHVLMWDEGSEPDHSDTQWTEECDCSCVECGFRGTGADLLRGHELWSQTVVCKVCEKETPAVTAHLHQGTWVGDNCCWDARLRNSE